MWKYSSWKLNTSEKLESKMEEKNLKREKNDGKVYTALDIQVYSFSGTRSFPLSINETPFTRVDNFSQVNLISR